VPTCVLVTGGAGFIGTNFVRYLLESDPSVRVVNLDALTYAASPANLDGVAEAYGDRYRFVRGDICDQQLVESLLDEERIDTIVHFAAESHVDRSIDTPDSFLQSNVFGTFSLLQAARRCWDGIAGRFHHISTDEVYGSLGAEGLFTETTAYDPSSPYSASKAASDHLVRAWARTFGLNVTVSNCSNNYGPYQFIEKLLPLMICNCCQGKALPVYGDGRNVRDWLFVEDHCRAIDAIVRHAHAGETYNVGGHNEWANIDIVHLLCDTMQQLRPPTGIEHYRELITYVKDRPGHDRRYAIDAGKIERDLGWRPTCTFEEGLERTIRWYLDHEDWVEAIRREKYDGERLGLSGPAATSRG
jgi:dTDP-glucose 4,6-dehydratase